MDARLQLRVQRYGWDAAAAYYDDGWQAQLRPAHDSLLDMTGISTGQSVVETACGSGLVTLRLAERVGPRGHVLATDLSEGMIDDMRARLRKTTLANVEAKRMPAEALDVPENTFDAAVCSLGLMYTPDPGVAVAEMARGGKPGGTVTATVWGERRLCGWAEVFPIVDARVKSEVCPMFFGTGAKGALVREFENAGLQRTREHRQSETLAFQSQEAFTDALLLGGPVALAVKRFSGDVMDEVRQELLSSVSDFRGGGGSYQIPGEFVTVTGFVPNK